MFDRILVPLDGSSVSMGVLPYVAYLAGGLNIPVVLMSAIDPGDLEVPREVPDLDARSYAGGVPLVSFTGGEIFHAAPDRPRPRGTPSVSSGTGDNLLLRTVNDAKIEVETWLRTFVTLLGQQGVQAEAVVSTGDRPAEEILRHPGCWSH
jgi:nucleotide-binding universal stress UspA family protein